MINGLILGVIEGFYGKPWSQKNRLACIDFLAKSQWNTYVWAAKQEPRHREHWNEPFTEHELDCFAELSQRSPRVQVAVGLTPGDTATEQQVINKLLPATHAGCKAIVLCFDDLPVLHAAQQHQHLAHAVHEAIGVPVWIVPTHYAGCEKSEYLTSLCDGLHPDIHVMWTGNTVVTDTISEDDIHARVAATGNRQPLVWDNTPVNDARMRGHLHMGPYTGRDASILKLSSGLLLNPMEEFSASLPTMVSAVAWAQNKNSYSEWLKYVESRGWRYLAEATSYRVDKHWPGNQPNRQWWNNVATMSVNDEQLEPWAVVAREGARLALAALDVLEGTAPQSQRDINKVLFQLMAWGEHRSRSFRVFGAGPRVRPIATQDASGRFVLLPESVQESESLVDQLVSSALERLRQ